MGAGGVDGVGGGVGGGAGVVGHGVDAGVHSGGGGGHRGVFGVLDHLDDAEWSWERPWWWFKTGRDGGGPTYYGAHISHPEIMWYKPVIKNVILFAIPFVAFLILLPSYRRKHWSSFGVLTLCLATGFLLTCICSSTSWLVGEVDLVMQNGPKQHPTPGKVGLWVGLWQANITYESSDLWFNEELSLDNKRVMVAAHRRALKSGWVWPLVSLMAELGGEGPDWPGLLGNGLRQAGKLSGFAIVCAMASWMLWMILFGVAPERTARPLMVTGVLLVSGSLSFAIDVWCTIPNDILLGGYRMNLHLGWAWWLACVQGFLLVACGVGLKLYSYRNPRKLTTIFELYAGTPYHRLFLDYLYKHESRCQPETTYQDYKNIYPSCYLQQEGKNGMMVYDAENNNQVHDFERGHRYYSNRVVRQITNPSTNTGRLIFYNRINPDPHPCSEMFEDKLENLFTPSPPQTVRQRMVSPPIQLVDGMIFPQRNMVDIPAIPGLPTLSAIPSMIATPERNGAGANIRSYVSSLTKLFTSTPNHAFSSPDAACTDQVTHL